VGVYTYEENSTIINILQRRYQKMYQSIGMDEFYQKVKREKLLIIDVREEEEYQQGHIPGARNYPLSTINENAEELDKTAHYYVICQSGGRSAQACAYLTNLPLNVTNVMGGMSAWKGDTVHGKL
jgi:rhodanese-related sulfurtransferase